MGSDYQDTLCKHLANYRANTLGIQVAGVFRYRGKDIEKPHILPKDQAWLNILPEVRGEVQAYVRNNSHVRLHRYFHHLNSSQAFALNLFVPFFEGGVEASHSLLRALGQNGSVAEDQWGVEIILDRNENTNIDAMWTTSLGEDWICEVKLSEREFGQAQDDDEHREKLSRTYAPLLRHHVPATFLDPKFFFRNYQILRNIWNMLQQDARKLLFLMPRANKPLWTQLDSVMTGLHSEIANRISAQAVEDVLTRLHADAKCPGHLRRYATLLAEKYICGLDAPQGQA